MPELTARPDLLDNLRPEGVHRDALAYLVEDIPAPRELSIATGYVNLGGLHHLATILDGGRRTRLMLGAQPEPGLGAGSATSRASLRAAPRSVSRRWGRGSRTPT
jgi:hypothetical protein